MTIPKTYVRATDGAANGRAYEARFARRMNKFSCAAALAMACLCLILLAGCGGGGTAVSVEIQPNTAQTVDASQQTCNPPGTLTGCQMINFVAAVGGDKSNSGVTWNLSVLSTGCTGAGCGTLINMTPVSVTYVAPPNIAAELTGVMLQAVSIASSKATSSIGISIVLDPTFTTTGLQQCAVGVFCLPSGSNGIAYNSNQALVVTNGVPPYTFSATATNTCPAGPLSIGTLPPGLTLNPGTGAIVGRPACPTAHNAAVTFQFTVQATDSSSTPVSVPETFQITITPPPTLAITTTSLPPGTLNTPFSAPISTTGGVTPITWSIVAPDTCATLPGDTGVLPTGLMLNPASGQITGIPSGNPAGMPTSCSFTAQVQDSSLPTGQLQTQLISVTLNKPQPLQITSSPNLPGGFTATPYGPLPLIATGGVGPYTWTVVTGQLPAGLTLAPNGTISGTPVLATNPPTDDFFTVQVADSEVNPMNGLPAPQTVAQVFNVTISTGVISPNTLLNGQYTFLFHGFDKSGPVTTIGHVIMGGNGALSGEEDIYRDFPATTSAAATLAGVYSIGTDGRGTMELVATSPVSGAVSTIDYRLVLDSGGGSGPPNVRFFEDNSTNTNNDAPNATHGEGIMKPAIASGFTASTFSGNYAFGFSGYEAAGVLPVALAGVVHADPSMNPPTLTGTGDFNDAGQYNGSLPLSGAFLTTVDSFGRGQAQLNFAQPGKSQVTLTFVFYFVSPSDLYFMEIDTPSTKSVFFQLNGEMVLQQPGFQFTNAALAGTSVATGTGLDANGNASVLAGLFTAPVCDGSTPLSLTYDQNDGGLITQPSFSGITCSVTTNGRAAFTQFASDTFERTNGPVGANWTATEGAFSIANDSVFLSAQGGDMLGSMLWNGASFFPDQFSQLTVTSAGGTGTSLGPAVRMQSSGENYYVLNYVVTVPASSSKISLQVVSSGVATTLGMFAHQVVPGDVLRLEIRGKSLTALLNGATIITATDSTFASGSPGIWGLNTTLAATGDDWSGGGLTTRVAAAYLTGPGQGFLIGSDTVVTTGPLELQSGGPSFLVSSIGGGYTLDTAVPQEKLVTNVIGQVYSAGGGNMTGTVDEYDPPSVADPEGLLHLGTPNNLISSYTLSANGRGTLGPNTITGFPQNLILYVVSPGSFRAISADATPGTGHPTVYFFNH